MTTDVPDAVRELRERLEEIQRTGVVASSRGTGHRPPATPAGSGIDRITAKPAHGDHSGGDQSGGDQPGGEQLSEEARAEEQQAKAICLRLLADSARPRAGLERKLLQRGISPAVITRVLDRFTEVGLIDDHAYAEAYVRTKHQERALSRRALTVELRRKGLDDSVAELAVETLDSADEELRATALVAKRVDSATAAGPEAARRRLLGLLDRRGYPLELSIRVVDTALRDRGDGVVG